MGRHLQKMGIEKAADVRGGGRDALTALTAVCQRLLTHTHTGALLKSAAVLAPGETA